MENNLILIIDDDQSVRNALSNLLRTVGHTVESCSSVEDYINRAGPIPSCLILDMRLPGISGLEFQRRLRQSGNKIPIIFLSGHCDVSISVQAMKDGALEFLTKPVHDQELLDVVQVGLEKGRALQREVYALEQLRCQFNSLSSREREILDLVTQGKKNKQIATMLDLAEVTVKVHRASAMKKVGAQTIVDLVRWGDRLKTTRIFSPIPAHHLGNSANRLGNEVSFM